MNMKMVTMVVFVVMMMVIIVMVMIMIMDHCGRHDNDDGGIHLDDCKLVSGNELADLGPEAKGWLSAKYCIYPQVPDLSGDLFRNDTCRKVLTLMHPFFTVSGPGPARSNNCRKDSGLNATSYQESVF